MRGRFREGVGEGLAPHDLEEILSHYSEDFQMTSPFIPTAMDEATGTLKGKDKVGEYWLKALDRYPELRFQTQMVRLGRIV